jgi:hypothetical protein
MMSRNGYLLVILSTLIIACGGGQPQPFLISDAGSPAGPGEDAGRPVTLPVQGDPCDPVDGCAPGLVCATFWEDENKDPVSYACYIECDDETPCGRGNGECRALSEGNRKACMRTDKQFGQVCGSYANAVCAHDPTGGCLVLNDNQGAPIASFCFLTCDADSECTAQSDSVCRSFPVILGSNSQYSGSDTGKAGYCTGVEAEGGACGLQDSGDLKSCAEGLGCATAGQCVAL